MPVACFATLECGKLELQFKKEVSGCSEWLHVGREEICEVHKGPQERLDIVKRLKNISIEFSDTSVSFSLDFPSALVSRLGSSRYTLIFCQVNSWWLIPLTK